MRRGVVGPTGHHTPSLPVKTLPLAHRKLQAPTSRRAFAGTQSSQRDLEHHDSETPARVRPLSNAAEYLRDTVCNPPLCNPQLPVSPVATLLTDAGGDTLPPAHAVPFPAQCERESQP